MAELGLSRWRLRGAASDELEVAVSEQAEAADNSADAGVQPVLRQSTLDAPQKRKPERVQEQRVPAQSEVSSQAEAAIEQARQAEISALDWDGLQAHLAAQPIRDGATQAVFGTGVRDASVMVVGEAPGAEEDRNGEPFVGRAGQLLDQMLGSIGLSRHENVYIANICKFRPPGNRDPRAEEIAADWPYLSRQIELIKPRVMLALGRIAIHSLLNTEAPVGKLRAQQHVFGPAQLPLVVTYHPAYLLRQPREKAKAWQDLKRLRTVLLSHVD